MRSARRQLVWYEYGMADAQLQHVTRRAARQLLDDMLLTAADFESFCIDYFPQIHRRFASGMDRISRTSILLESTDVTQILEGLRQCRGAEAVDTRLMVLCQAASYVRDLELEALGHDREALEYQLDQHLSRSDSGHGPEIAALQEKIAAVKRKQRRGPQLHEDEVLSDRYVLRNRIGRGGFGDVWLAFDRYRKSR